MAGIRTLYICTPTHQFISLRMRCCSLRLKLYPCSSEVGCSWWIAVLTIDYISFIAASAWVIDPTRTFKISHLMRGLYGRSWMTRMIDIVRILRKEFTSSERLNSYKNIRMRMRICKCLSCGRNNHSNVPINKITPYQYIKSSSVYKQTPKIPTINFSTLSVEFSS